MAKRKDVAEAIVQQVKDVVESQAIDVETLCMWLGIDQMDIINAFEDHVLSNAANFGVNPAVVADVIESEVEETDDINEDYYS